MLEGEKAKNGPAADQDDDHATNCGRNLVR
jgi:hypothetical protein